MADYSADQMVILGNHRDAWVFGAVDASSGTALQMELARVLGDLISRGVYLCGVIINYNSYRLLVLYTSRENFVFNQTFRPHYGGLLQW